MDYRWIESPHNTYFRAETIIAYNRIKRIARWPKKRSHGDEKLIIYFTWPKAPNFVQKIVCPGCQVRYMSL